MAIEWAKLRTLDGTQHRAFEELCCQLAAHEEVPEGSKFTRKGTPDAGVEAFWTLSDGAEYGWQAKFFLSSPDNGQWQQIDKSVHTALEKHPRLTRYTICLPVDRSDARIEGQKSFLERWNDHDKTWKSWRKSGAAVEFAYWGAHEIWERLGLPENRGRHLFWFDHELLTAEWLKGRLAEAIKNVGPRYTPALNVELPISHLFDGLSRTASFYGRIEKRISEIRGKAAFIKRASADDEILKAVKARYASFLDAVDLLSGARAAPIDWPVLRNASIGCCEAATAAVEALRASEEQGSAHSAESGAQSDSAGDGRSVAERKRGYEYDLNSLRRAVREFVETLDSEELALANLPALLIVGEAGTGKTHLLCDIAERWQEGGLPAIMLLGQQFADVEPWSEVVKLLRFSGDSDEFLGALNAAGELSGARALLLIDAINEGKGRELWPKHLAGFLEVVRRYPWIAISLTIRSSYEAVAIPENLVPKDLVRVAHYGFASKEYEAVAQFFKYYGIELPSVPPLIPEFQNPLFLKLFCEGLKNEGLTRVPRGLQGITAVFRFYVDSVEKKLAKELDLDPKARWVQKGVDGLSAEMANRAASWLPREEAKNIVDKLLPAFGFDRSLFNRLVSEGVLAEDLHFESDAAKYVDVVRFGYERFSDHLIVAHLLREKLNTSEPEKSFEQEGPLQALVADERACALNQGLIEALSIQLPEETGKELIDIVPSCRTFSPIREAFVESLIWRAQNKFFESTLAYVNSDIIRYRRTHRQFLDALLTVAAIPEHPYNARMLHGNLRSRTLPERDAWWSIWLNEQAGTEGAVDRLIDWAWHGGEKSHISDGAVHLAAIALTWFLTSSNRRLRDRATKALVALLEKRLPILIQLLGEFLDVDDPYVTERLFAVAYGCAMRNVVPNAIRDLAQYVYEQIFKAGVPPPNLLLRDHARGIIELALAQGLHLEIEAAKIRPPYKSEWPNKIPSQKELEKYREWHEGMPEAEWSRVNLYDSVLDHGDFARYIIGTNSGWTQWSFVRLGDARVPSAEELHEEFLNSLTEEQRELWRNYEEAREAVGGAWRAALRHEENQGTSEESAEVKDAEKAAAEREQQLNWGLSEPQRELFRRIKGREGGRADLRFDLTLAQRYIFNRVLELGWTVERFGKFDRECGGMHGGDRGEQTVERIGKKYQWIALYECFARIADNFQWLKDSDGESYEGPWRPFQRNIDPSFLLSRTKGQHFPPYSRSWWFPITYEHLPDEPDDKAWLEKKSDLPPVSPLVQVVFPVQKSEWLTLEGTYWWQQEKEPDEDYGSSHPRRSLYYIVRSYCVKKEEADHFFNWAAEQNFFGRWMPEPGEVYHAYLGEFFWAPSVARDFDLEGWETDDRVPCPVRVTSAGYLWEKGYDKSVEDVVRIALPARWIWREMNLNWLGVEGRFFDQSGNLVCFDPSVKEEGLSALLFRRDALVKFLEKQGLALVWTVLGEKQILSSRGDSPGWAAISGAFKLRGDGLEGNLQYFPELRMSAD